MVGPLASPQVLARDLPVMRAAYSDRSAALMATLARLAYNFPPVGGTPGPASIPIEVSKLGFNKVTYFHNGLKDGWAFLAEGPDIIAITFAELLRLEIGKQTSKWGCCGLLTPTTVSVFTKAFIALFHC